MKKAERERLSAEWTRRLTPFERRGKLKIKECGAVIVFSTAKLRKLIKDSTVPKSDRNTYYQYLIYRQRYRLGNNA